MPVGIFKSVREVSSEDAVHSAVNLLKENAGKKWKTQSTGEKAAHIILEFEEPQQITGIDIGNEHSAFVEVLVSKTGCQQDDFKEMLLSSSFMTPIESKNSSNVNRVRCFSSDALSITTLPDKWKLVKIVCTQPFNKHVQYGLSFIKMHVSSSTAAAKAKPLVPDKFKLAPLVSQFKLREESPDSDPDGKGSSALFQRWKASRNEVSAAAAIRDAASPAALRRLSDTRPAPLKVQASTSSSSSAVTKTETKLLDRNRNALLFGDDDPDEDENEAAKLEDATDAKKQRLSKHIEADRSRRRFELEKELEQKKGKNKRQSIDTPKESPKPTAAAASSVPKESPKPKPGAARPQKRLSSSIDDVSSPAKKQKVKADKTIQYVPFNQLLRGVVLVISGIQNPDRADLRSKAVALGAKYKADWEAGCTHLICAFRNTPKYNQVKGKGKIVTRSWIEKCYTLKKYLPWRRYALDTTESGQPESDEELFDISLKPTVDDDDDDKHVEMQVKSPKSEKHEAQSSDPDTEDELERVSQKNKLKKTSEENQNNIKNKTNELNQKPVSKLQNVYEASTDEEEYLQELRRK
ncbi:DNA repair protein XRCC1 [Drosophila innubila]|uniref:DNA repair protein XRCC1 n=1 Tax=Drosophila innubila TaxID=198719 RepID=UPI00148D684F|nr:DNA repair protein XRCC1 [Drosophila innubila]